MDLAKNVKVNLIQKMSSSGGKKSKKCTKWL
jgi:hypothetical protein